MSSTQVTATAETATETETESSATQLALPHGNNRSWPRPLNENRGHLPLVRFSKPLCARSKDGQGSRHRGPSAGVRLPPQLSDGGAGAGAGGRAKLLVPRMASGSTCADGLQARRPDVQAQRTAGGADIGGGARNQVIDDGFHSGRDINDGNIVLFSMACQILD